MQAKATNSQQGRSPQRFGAPSLRVLGSLELVASMDSTEPDLAPRAEKASTLVVQTSSKSIADNRLQAREPLRRPLCEGGFIAA